MSKEAFVEALKVVDKPYKLTFVYALVIRPSLLYCYIACFPYPCAVKTEVGGN